jgi:hypothetical protein
MLNKEILYPQDIMFFENVNIAYLDDIAYNWMNRLQGKHKTRYIIKLLKNGRRNNRRNIRTKN